MVSLRFKLRLRTRSVYFSFLRHDTQEISDTQLLATVIMQLVQNSRTLSPKIIKEYFTNHPSLSSTILSEILIILAQGFDRIYVVLDGLEQTPCDSGGSVLKICMGTLNSVFLIIVTNRKGYGVNACAMMPSFFFST